MKFVPVDSLTEFLTKNAVDLPAPEPGPAPMVARALDPNAFLDNARAGYDWTGTACVKDMADLDKRMATYVRYRNDADFAAWDTRTLEYDILAGQVKIPAPMGFANAQDGDQTFEEFVKKTVTAAGYTPSGV